MTPEELEEERIRLEQESLPVARAPVWAGSAASDIDAANAAQPMQRSFAEPGQEARGFIAADVSPTGEVISGSYDSTQDDLRNVKAQEMAMRYKGQRLYSSLIEGGATPAEAYRASAHLINFSDPAAAVKMEALMQKNKPTPLETITRDGRTFFRTGPHSFQEVREKKAEKPPPMVKGTIPPDVKVADSMLAEEIKTKRGELAKGFKYAQDPVDPGKVVKLPFTAREKMAMEAAIQEAENKRLALFQSGGHLNPAYNPNVDQTGWNQMKDRWNNPPPEPAPAAPAPPATQPKEVRRKDEKGRVAIFDAETKKFLRYAN